MSGAPLACGLLLVGVRGVRGRGFVREGGGAVPTVSRARRCFYVRTELCQKQQ